MTPAQRLIQDKIRKSGEHQIIGVSDNPTFSYSIGLLPKFGHELLTVGMGPHVAALIINDIAAKLDHIELDVPDPRWVEGFMLVFKLAHPQKVRDYVVQADVFHEHHVPVVQIVYPDPRGIFPWQHGYSLPGILQPSLWEAP